MGRGPKPAKGKAKPTVPRKSRTNEDSKVRDLEKHLAEALRGRAEAQKREGEALEQQTATSEANAPGRLRLTVYPGATHVFDFNAPPRRNEYGKYLTYDPDATRDAARRVEGFLREIVK